MVDVTSGRWFVAVMHCLGLQVQVASSSSLCSNCSFTHRKLLPRRNFVSTTHARITLWSIYTGDFVSTCLSAVQATESVDGALGRPTIASESVFVIYTVELPNTSVHRTPLCEFDLPIAGVLFESQAVCCLTRHTTLGCHRYDCDTWRYCECLPRESERRVNRLST